MIRTWLLPAVLPVGVLMDAVLRVHNTADLACINLVLEFELPPQLVLERGRRCVELERLGADEQYDHLVALRALVPGRCVVAIPNFSFRDGAGRSQRIRDRTVEVDVQPEVDPRSPVESTKAPPRQAPAPAAGSVFISYRRSDARWVEGRLFERLRRHFPYEQVFFDRSSIPLGEDFRRRLDAELASCAALLALIGPNWLSAVAPGGGRRLDVESDILRHEIAVALGRDISSSPCSSTPGCRLRRSCLPTSAR